MIMTTTGSMGPEMEIAVKRAARLLAEKRDESYSQVMSILRSRFAFNAMRSALICLRGSRGIRPANLVSMLDSPAELTVSELRLERS